ncbi:hypothetical protein R3P38DRAFT_2851788 [Favolaschia claudopus]|uniref:BRCT domain-containing protein n=1 Tax=Favolaschia claudopus TaxID=2862362 RepID=A0AAW0DRG5_9AGAR
MQRRANKSKKVPNVRLRPATANAVASSRGASPEQTSWWAPDSQIVGSDDTVMTGGSCPRPFKNFVICATGISDKPTLFKLALELGATTVSAFTDRVTHLIAENHGGAKYLCALERQIPILLPAWIIECHRVWQHGDDVEIETSVTAHRLPVFSGVTLCISGISEIVRRTEINKLVTAHGGTYVKALERPVRVTHLLCAGEEETDKMRYAEKFNRAGEANPPIQLVWEEWLWDSLEYGGRFEEAKYQARMPRPQPRSTQARPPPRNLHVNDTEAPSAFDDDADDEVVAPVQRLPAVTLQLWGSLLKPRGYEVDGARGSVALSPKKAREIEQEVREKGETEAPRDREAGGSVLAGASFRRANSIHIEAGSSRGPFGNASAKQNASAGPSRVKRLEEKTAPEPSARSTVFAGVRFLLRGETDNATVRQAVEEAGGAAVGLGEVPDFIIVRLVSGSPLYAAETSTNARARYRTECWLERCLFVDRICGPEEHATFVPIGVQLPVPDADRITLSFSGLDVSEACWVKRLLKALGIPLAPVFSRQTTHLLCPSGTGVKYTKARQWGVPVVDMGWLAAMASTGVVPLVTAFLVVPAKDDATTAPASPKKNDKGKGKADDTSVQMQDITNSYDSQESPPQDGPGAGSGSGFFLPPPPPPRELTSSLSFGRPDASLNHAPTTPSPPKRLVRRQSTSAAVNTPSRVPTASPLPLVTHAVPPPIPTQSTASSGSFTHTASSSGAAGLRRAATVGTGVRIKQEHDLRVTARPVARGVSTSSSPARVPSSMSPSPLRRGVSVSPPKIPDHRTKALQESIVSLLGKRPATPEDAETSGRAGKRGRPHRSKPQSRQPSDVLPVLQQQPLESVFGGGRSFSPGPEDAHSVMEGMSMGAEEQSLRVMYEDPGQRAELQRLASLIGEPLDDTSKRKPPRRSSRRS